MKKKYHDISFFYFIKFTVYSYLCREFKTIHNNWSYIKHLLDEVVAELSTFCSADNSYRDIDNFAYHKKRVQYLLYYTFYFKWKKTLKPNQKILLL